MRILNSRKLIIYFLPLFFVSVFFLSFIIQEEFIFPLADFPSALLSGNFGEIRNHHFHLGLDIRTNEETGYSVRASADGYVSRIFVSPVGFGKAVYITHPDGKTAVYAHLESFNETIREYVRARQYNAKKFAQDLYLSAEEIPIKQGEIIGKSGNTGSSGGPHLHFEIRDCDESPLNPMKYNFTEIKDAQAPVFRKIAFEPLGISSRINGEFEKKIVPVYRLQSGEYVIRDSIFADGLFGIEMGALDYQIAGGATLGIYQAQLFIDEKQIFGYRMDKISYDERRNMDIHIDYAYAEKKNMTLEKLYRDNGNSLKIYSDAVNDGKIILRDSIPHEFKIILSDASGNQSTLKGKIYPKKYLKEFYKISPVFTNGNFSMKYEVNHAVLKIIAKNYPILKTPEGKLFFQSSNDTIILTAEYVHNNQTVFLYHLERVAGKIPSGFIAEDYPKNILTFNITKKITPQNENSFADKNFIIQFPEYALFDTLYMIYKIQPKINSTYSNLYSVNDKYIPLYKNITVKIRPDSFPQKIKSKLCVAIQNGNSQWSYAGNKWEEEYLTASSSSLGIFSIVADTSPPTIRNYNFKSGDFISPAKKTMEFLVADNFSGISSYNINGYIDGQWVLFEYDPKTNRIIHPTDYPKLKKGKHELTISVSDEAGNMTTKNYIFYN